MSRLSLKTYLLLILLSVGIWGAMATLCVMVGTNSLGLPLNSVGQLDMDLFSFRRDLVLHASLVGAALSAAGVVYQSLLRNPLADPYLLGVASGATLGATLWKLPAFALIPLLSATGQQTSALMGALLTIFLIFTLSARRGRLDPMTLLLTGVILSSLCSALLILLIAIKPELLAGAGGVSSLLIGGIQTNLAPMQFLTAAVTICLGMLILAYVSASLSIATLSDTEATSLGLRIHRLRWIALAVASIMVASAVSISGPIGFVGLIAPHLARLLVGPDPRKTLPVATALGATLLCSSDALCRLLAHPNLLATLLPAGVLTSLLGAPFFLTLLMKERSRTQ